MIKVDKLYTYIINHDTGFSPNPFWGILTLACCKPKIRISIGSHWVTESSLNTLIVGISPKHQGNRIIYIMKVTGCLSFSDYWEHYPQKRPDMRNDKAVFRKGDNIYKPDSTNPFGFFQLHSAHSLNPKDDNWKENLKNKEKDLGGKFVLVSNCFAYFGKEPVIIPEELSTIIPGRGHKCIFPIEIRDEFSRFISGYQPVMESGAIIQKPSQWPLNDNSWKNENYSQ